MAQQNSSKQSLLGGGRNVATTEQPNGTSRLLGRLFNPIVDIPDNWLRGPIGDFAETGLESLTSPVGLAATLLSPFTGGTSLGVAGAAGTAIRVGSIVGGEALINASADRVGQKVSELIPEDAPGFLRIGAPLVASALTAGGVSSGVRRAFGTQTTNVTAQQLAKAYASGSTSPDAVTIATGIAFAKRVPDAVTEAANKQFHQAQAAAMKAAGGAKFQGVGTNTGSTAIKAGAGATVGTTRKAINLQYGAELKAAFPKAVENISDQIWDTGLLGQLEKNQAYRALTDLAAGSLPAKSDLKMLEIVTGPSITHALNLSGSSTLDATMKLLNGPRALIASADFSFSLRQGIILAAGHPVAFGKTMKSSIKAFFDEDYYNYANAWLRADKVALSAGGATAKDIAKAEFRNVRARQAGVALLDTYNLKEESFYGSLIGPFDDSIASSLMKRSGRSFTLASNLMRRDLFDKFADGLGSAASSARLKEYGGFLNAATGRGPEWLNEGKLGKALNASFFAPGYIVSRFIAPTYLFRAKGAARKQVMYDMGTFVGAGMAGLSLLWLAGKSGTIPGLSVEHDPRSTDFGKIRYNNTRYDFWGGYQQIARTVVQTVSGERKSSSGRIVPLDSHSQALERFTRSKLSPAASLAADLLKGETYLGKKLDLTDVNSVADDVISERLIPLAWQDLMDGFNQGGPIGGLLATPGEFGVGTQTYMSTGELKDELSFELFKKEHYDELTGAERKILEQHPKMVDKAREEEGKADADFSTRTQEIEGTLVQSQQIYTALLQSGQMSYKDYADAMADASIAATNKRQQAAVDFSIVPNAPDSSAAMALQGWYALSEKADVGYASGIQTGRRDWEEYDRLEQEYLDKLTPAEKLFIDERGRRTNAPEAQWYYDNRDYVTNSGYNDSYDRGYERYRSSVLQQFPGVENYSQLQETENSALLAGDQQTYNRAHRLLTHIRSFVTKDHERLRRRDPQLDAALYLTGRTTTFQTRAAESIWRGYVLPPAS